MRSLTSQKGGAPGSVDAIHMIMVTNGTQAATATTCNIQRGSHRGRRLGHCSNRPKTSITMKPRLTKRTTADHQPEVQPRPNSAPQKNEYSSVKTTRCQPNASAKPRGGEGSDTADMAEE